MKTKKICRITLFLLILFCLPGAAVRAFAAEVGANSAGNYGIEIAYRFGDSEEKEHSPEDYQENIFLLMDQATGQYIQAEYDQEAGGYVLSGCAEDKADATFFHCGVDQARPYSLLILGLPEGTYTLIQEQTKEGYQLLRDSVEIHISADGSSVDGYDVEMTTYGDSCYTALLTIANRKYFELPSVYPSSWAMFTAHGGYLFISFGAIVIITCCILLFGFRKRL